MSMSGFHLFGQNIELKNVMQTGGVDWDMVKSIYIDNDKNIFTTGSFQQSFVSEDKTLTSLGVSDIIYEKLDENNNVEWLNTAGGRDRRRNTLGEFGKRILADANGVYLTGVFYGQANFSSEQVSSRGKEDIFLTKLSNNGEIEWIKSAGGISQDLVHDMALDKEGNIYITGCYQHSITFDNNNVLDSKNGTDVFLSKYDNSGNLKWVRTIGSNGNAVGKTLRVEQNRIYLSGEFEQDLSVGNKNVKSRGKKDIFFSIYDFDGALTSLIRYGGENSESVEDITVVNKTLVFVGNVDSSTEGHTLIGSIGTDGVQNWIQSIGGSHHSMGKAIDYQSDQIIVAGNFEDEFEIESNVFRGFGSTDVFLLSLNQSGQFNSLEVFGGEGQDMVQAMNIKDETLYLAGIFRNSIESEGINLNSVGESDNFLLSFSIAGPPDQPFLEEVSDINIYPNPASEKINIQIRNLENTSVRIHDIHGRILYVNDEIISDILEINTSRYEAGIYFIEVHSTGFSTTRKVFVE